MDGTKSKKDKGRLQASLGGASQKMNPFLAEHPRMENIFCGHRMAQDTDYVQSLWFLHGGQLSGAS